MGVQPPERPNDPMGSGPAAVPVSGAVPRSLAPASGVPTPSPAAGGPPNRRLRLWLAMMAGTLALLCLGGVGVVVSLYDGATEIKRTSPDAVVDNFLGAYLVDRNDKEASLYECKQGGDFAAIEAYRADMLTREKDFSVGIRVSWSSLTVSTQGDSGTVGTNLVKTATDQSGRVSNTWEFRVVDQDGWRVCGAIQTS